MPSRFDSHRAAFAAKRETASRERQQLADAMTNICQRAQRRRAEHLRVLSDLDVEETLYPHMSRRRASR